MSLPTIVAGIEQEIVSALRIVSRIRYSELASSTIIVFDHLLTLDQEIELIWRSPWSLGKSLFLMTRYYTLVTVIFNNFALFSDELTTTVCLAWYRWQGWTGVVSFVLAELILQLRLYAMYSLNKKILIFMGTTFLICAAASATIMGLVLAHIRALPNEIPGTAFCVAIDIPRDFFAFWVPMLVSESILCGLALYRGLDNYRRGGTLYQSGRHLFRVLIRDSAFYFVVVFATYFTNALIFTLGSELEVEIPIGFAVALSCVMSNRLCLNVRGMVREEVTSISTSRPRRQDVSVVTIPRPAGTQRSTHTVTVGSGSQLTEFEMLELRSMRADPVSSV
ncbi:hypothetical protein CERSUDRAFT_84781 [Gelatoporia subvermispora B]|uniref:DUF6533 domain-containing protein n=1 Tax=Ceriporiopsis subvermispora (strain B) TaxID=914234 RepID=M2PK16_CERS8|nr:hypothetical protein CERSUDRAFT_84781 [Gelatoporia subvermispora B]